MLRGDIKGKPKGKLPINDFGGGSDLNKSF